MTSRVVWVELSNWSHLFLRFLSSRLVWCDWLTESSCWISKRESRRTIMTLWWQEYRSVRWVARWIVHQSLEAHRFRTALKNQIIQVGRSWAGTRNNAKAPRKHPKFFKNFVPSSKFGSGKKRLHSSFSFGVPFKAFCDSFATKIF